MDTATPRVYASVASCVNRRDRSSSDIRLLLQLLTFVRALAAENPLVERVMRSISCECTDHIVALGEGHLRRVLRENAEYYNCSRCHLSLDRNSPEPREVESCRGAIRSTAHLGGLHHRHYRAA